MATILKSTSRSGKARIRESSNADQATPISINERILKECNLIYTDGDKGLIKVAEQFGLKLLAPRRKIVILLIGNHSAGKSSFINWYIEEHVQKTGVAIETQGFVIVTSGKRRESLMGNATLHLYPHFKPLERITGVVDFLSTEISTSKQNKFSLITFVDTPGLVDGDTHYPFDVNDAILWLGGLADLILVFFDPIGQALCKRTLCVVEQLNIGHVEKMRFYLSKADDAGNEADRQKVMMQIVQELCKRPGLNRTGFDMPTIFIPDVSKNTKCVNQIDTICQEIERVIDRNIQKTLNSLEGDCELLLVEIKRRLDSDQENRAYNFKNFTRAILIGGIAAILPLLILLNIIIVSIGDDSLIRYMAPVQTMWSFVPEEKQLPSILCIFIFSYVLFTITRWSLGFRSTLSRKQRKQFLEFEDYINNSVKSKTKTLYRDYLEQSVGDHDL